MAKSKAAKSKSAKSKAAKPTAGNNLEKRSPEENIEALKRRAEELCGGQMQAGGLDDCPAEMEEDFWKHVVEYEESPWTTQFKQLEDAGVSLPAPDSLNDEALTAKLWEVIQKLALLRVFISQTDHLSDRELYTELWSDILRQETKAMPLGANAAYHIEMLGSWSEEDTDLYLKYYADEEWRRQWRKDWPKHRIPAHEDLPYDRDRLLPQAEYGPAADEEVN